MKEIARALFMLTQQNQRTVSFGDMNITVPQSDFGDYMEINRLTSAEKELARGMSSRISVDGVFYDVGANLGIHSAAIAKSSGCDVVAFEPRSDVATKCRQTFDLNGVVGEVCEKALSDQSERTTISTPDAHGQSAIGAGHTRIESVRGDDLSDYPSPTLMKIDVEGHEMAVLRGFEETLSDLDDLTVYVEVHTDHGVAVSDVEEFLSSCGFSVTRRSHRGEQPLLVAE